MEEALPFWATVETARITEHFFNAKQEQWETSTSFVRLAKEPFAQGAQRAAYRMKKMERKDHPLEEYKDQTIGDLIRGLAVTGAKFLAAKLHIHNRATDFLEYLESQHLQLHGTELSPDPAVIEHVNFIFEEVIHVEEQRGFARESLEKVYSVALGNLREWMEADDYVGKCYMSEEVPREAAFEDVKLQMISRLWAQAYNEENPPRPIEMIPLTIAEFVDREDKPIYALEQLITGEYVKYNNNTGALVEDATRHTPQTFSHFTFERSNHKIMVVDIQGVFDGTRDVWTDPQIHSADGKGFGEGNLGIRGMALFFSSHRCNTLCQYLQLRPFRLSPPELKIHDFFEAASHEKDKKHAHSSDGKEESKGEEEADAAGGSSGAHSESGGTGSKRFHSWARHATVLKIYDNSPIPLNAVIPKDDKYQFPEAPAEAESKEMETPLPPAARGPTTPKSRNAEAEQIRSAVHYDLAVCHAIGRLEAMVNAKEEEKKQAMLFHLTRAADRSVEAQTVLARLYSGWEDELFPEDLVLVDQAKSFSYWLAAAQHGDRDSMVHVAQAYESGITVTDNTTTKKFDASLSAVSTPEKARAQEALVDPSWRHACMWYKKAAKEKGEKDVLSFAPYILLAKAAHLLEEGGYGLDADIEEAAELYSRASEMAMADGKGSAAGKYMMKAQELQG